MKNIFFADSNISILFLPICDVLHRPGGRCKILGVLMTFTACYACSLELLGVPNSTFFLISKRLNMLFSPTLPVKAVLCCIAMLSNAKRY